MTTDCCRQAQFPYPPGCGCCEGIEPLTPLATDNRPGLSTLAYRIGTHASFLESMKARLSNGRYPELSGLTTREASDPAIALLDVWATVADVLTFYQERIANEGYLRTATERRSVLELARLVGYALRPGVAATAYLAYTVDENTEGEVSIPKGSKVQSVPNPGEFPQTFESSEELIARADWSALKPRLNRPQYVSNDNGGTLETLYLKGTVSAKANDRLLLVFDDGKSHQTPRQVSSSESQFVDGQTKVQLIPPSSPGTAAPPQASSVSIANPFVNVAGLLASTPVVLPLSPAYLLHSTSDLFGQKSAVNAKLLTAYRPDQKGSFYNVLKTLPVTESSALKTVAVMGIKAGVHGRTAPLRPVFDENGAMVGSEEWPLAGIKLRVDVRQGVFVVSVTNDEGIHSGSIDPNEQPTTIELGNGYVVDYKFSDIENEGPKYSFSFKLNHNELETISISFVYEGSVVAASTAIRTITAASIERQQYRISIKFEMEKAKLTETVTPGHRLRRTGIAEGGRFRVTLSLDRELSEASAALELMMPLPKTDSLRKVIALDGQYDQIAPGSWVIVERPGQPDTITKVDSVGTVSKTVYNLPATVTQLTLAEDWLNDSDVLLSDIRDTVVYAQSDSAALAEEPVTDDIADDDLELDALVDGLEPGRWLIVSGERTDLGGATGVKSTELAMLASVAHDVARVPVNGEKDLPGDRTHTWLRLNNKLAHTYKRDTVTIFANVVKATHGETRQEVLGSGDGGKGLQSFALKATPLTFVAAATPSGVQSTLDVRVNDLLWHEADALAGLTPTDHRYVIRTDDEGKTFVQFGNGLSGARLPTGSENVRAVYRNGIGKAGNVEVGQLSLPMTRPTGVKDVINPLRASGGADRETRDSARRNAPLRVMALDRLVSVSDYADFARSFAGIGKAAATRLSDGRRELVHVTIAGADDIPIDESSDLYRNLVNGLRRHGDPAQPLMVAERELLLVLLKARIKVEPDYLWALVEPKVRFALLDAFGFDRRALGQDMLLSEVIAAIQGVPGVAYVDIDELDATSEEQLGDFLEENVGQTNGVDLYSFLRSKRSEALVGEEESRPRSRIPVELARSDGIDVKPAQLAILSSDVEITLILEEIPS
jgi:predicted phage baseplate assembly protein